MDSKKILPGFIFLFGEFLIIVSFLYLGKDVPTKILALNIAVTTVIYFLCALQLISPKFKAADRSQRWVGSLGIQGYSFTLYSIAAIVAMIVKNRGIRFDINTQVIVHGILLFMLLVGVYLATYAGDTVEAVYTAQTNDRYGLDEVRRSVAGVNSKLSRQQNSPKDIVARLSAFQENLRYVSPSDAPEAQHLEKEMAAEIKKLDDSLFTSQPDHDKVMQILQNCEVICRDRKQVYSN